jgi:SAM-dependent methyltransferase
MAAMCAAVGEHGGARGADEAAAVLHALARGDRDGALSSAATSSAASPLAEALHRFLVSDRTADPYTEPSAFQEFIESGDNPALYAATIHALQELHAALDPASVLDIGCGDGRVTAATLAERCGVVDLVEPSAPLLRDATNRIQALGSRPEVHPHRTDALSFVDEVAATGQTWDVAQSTFALHAMPRTDRAQLLTHLRERAGTVAIVEFDAPPGDAPQDTRIPHLAQRYARAIEVYEAHQHVVDGFLMPVLVGQILPGARRHTFEEPITEWCGDLEAPGFSVTSTPLFDHWWATAHLVVVRSLATPR